MGNVPEADTRLAKGVSYVRIGYSIPASAKRAHCNANTLSRRCAELGIKTMRQGQNSKTTPPP